MPIVTKITLCDEEDRNDIERVMRVEKGFHCQTRTYLTDDEGEVTEVLHLWSKVIEEVKDETDSDTSRT